MAILVGQFILKTFMVMAYIMGTITIPDTPIQLYATDETFKNMYIEIGYVEFSTPIKEDFVLMKGWPLDVIEEYLEEEHHLSIDTTTIAPFNASIHLNRDNGNALVGNVNGVASFRGNLFYDMYLNWTGESNYIINVEPIRLFINTVPFKPLTRAQKEIKEKAWRMLKENGDIISNLLENVQ